MPNFQSETLRDASYKARLKDMLDRIRVIQEENTFVGYASQRGLLTELQEVYQENLKHYREDYQANLAAYQQLIEEVAQQREELAPDLYQSLTKAYGEIEAKLAVHNYEENRAAAALISQTRENLGMTLSGTRQWETGMAELRQELKDLMTSVWAEDYAKLKAAYQQIKHQGPRLSSFSKPQLDAQQVAAFQLQRQSDHQTALKKFKGKKRALKKLMALEGKYVHKIEALALQKRLARAGRMRKIALGGIAAITLIALLGVLLAYPIIQKDRQEDEVWTQTRAIDNWEGYEHYLSLYPEGKYIQKAQEALLLLPYGRVKDLKDHRDMSFDYEGELDAGIPEGQGTAQFSDQSTYTGAWKAGNPFGQGSMRYPDGSNYSGEWEMGIKHGSGTLTMSNGDTYTGEWQFDKRQGQGTLLYHNGSKYLGNWSAGYPEGQGTFLAGQDPTEERIQAGWMPGSSYIGHWKQGFRHGTGTFSWPEGKVYQGKWQDDRPHGKGNLVWQDGSTFKGEWKMGQIDGPGLYYSRLREDYEGIWKGNPSKIALYDTAMVIIKQGRWENGLFISR